MQKWNYRLRSASSAMTSKWRWTKPIRWWSWRLHVSNQSVLTPASSTSPVILTRSERRESTSAAARLSTRNSTLDLLVTTSSTPNVIHHQAINSRYFHQSFTNIRLSIHFLVVPTYLLATIFKQHIRFLRQLEIKQTLIFISSMYTNLIGSVHHFVQRKF